MVDLMQRFEDDFCVFEEQFFKVRDSRVWEYRENIYKQFDTFFEHLHSHLDLEKARKLKEVDDIFSKLKIDDLSDVDKY